MSYGRLRRAWRAFRKPLLESDRYQVPRHLRVLYSLAKLLAPVWALLILWLFRAVALQMLEPMPEASDADGRRVYFYTIGLTITALGALLAAPLVLVRTFVSERQTQAIEEQRGIAEQTHFTTLYSKAIEQLGANATVRVRGREQTVPAIEIRMGAIYALERIAAQSDADYRPIVETLSAYVRRNSGPVIEINMPDLADSETPESNIPEERRARLEALRQLSSSFHDIAEAIRKEVRGNWREKYGARSDVSAALDVLIRRPGERRRLEGYETDEAPSLTEFSLFDGIDTDSTAWLSLSHEDANAIVKANIERQHRQALERRFGKVEDFKNRMAAWTHPHQDDAWTPDLSGAVFQGISRNDIDFQRFDLRGVRLEGAMFFGPRLQGANLEGARMDGAFLEGADLRGANLQRARMSGAFLLGAVMDGADLLGARMRDADLSSARMAGAGMDGVRAECARFCGAHLEGAYLGGARLEGADFKGADLEGAQMGASLAQRRLMDIALFGAAHVVSHEEREEARLTRAMGFMPMLFRAANLAEARFENADLRAVQMDDAVIEGADLHRASLRAADLSRVRGLAQNQLDAAFGDGSVQLPGGISRPPDWPSEVLNDEAYYGRLRNWIESQNRPWPHAQVFAYWEAVESIPYDRPADASERVNPAGQQ